MLAIYIHHTNTTRYGLNSIYRKSIDAWNHFNKQLKDKNLSNLSRYKLKKLIIYRTDSPNIRNILY